jgi:predicted ArsR family transcriptional regulator
VLRLAIGPRVSPLLPVCSAAIFNNLACLNWQYSVGWLVKWCPCYALSLGRTMTTLTHAAPTADSDLLDLLRTSGPMGVYELACQIEVTPTAVRQRLSRLLAQGLVDREAIRIGRGRPKHRYQLTQKGLRLTGSNFADLAMVLWREIGAIEEYEVRRTVLRRVVKALAEAYGRQIDGRTVAEKMEALARLLEQRRVPFSVSVQQSDGLPVLTAHACPYPELAERDRTICVLERVLFSEVLGMDVELAHCRLDGGGCCQFQPS